MTYDLFRRFSKSIQILGLVLVSIFYSAQSLAFIIFDGPERQGELVIEQNSPEIIRYQFTLDTIRLFLNFYEVSFSDEAIPNNLQYPLTLEITALDGLIPSNTITFDGDKTFTLGDWSPQYRGFGSTMTFTIPFSRSALENWIRDKLANNEPAELSFYVVGHGFKIVEGYAVTSSHKVTIPIRKQDYAHISGLEDIILPQRNAEGFCVSSTTGDANTGGKITLDVASTNGFKLLPQTSGDTTTGSYAIGYSITLEGNSDGLKKETLTQPGPSNIQWEAHHANFLDEDCGKADNMALWVTMNGSEADAAPTGKYTDEVTITVAPAS